MAKEFGPLMTVKFGSVTTIVASSTETAKEILHTHDQSFANRPILDSVTTQPHPEGTLAWILDYQIWRNHRRICSTQMFTSQRLDFLQHFHHKKVHQLLAHINKYKGTPVDIGSLAFATVNVYYVMGFRPNYFTCIAHLYLYYTLLVPHTYVSYIRHWCIFSHLWNTIQILLYF